MLHAYCLSTMSEHRELKRVVGIALDASPKVTGRKGGSEDMLALEVHEWTPELEAQVKDLREKFDILDPTRVIKSVSSTDEYPAPAESAEARRKKAQAESVARARKAKKLLRQQNRAWRVELKTRAPKARDLL